jgi:hypothetical protein
MGKFDKAISNLEIIAEYLHAHEFEIRLEIQKLKRENT